ncbi:hypothetical protein [Stenotrophomonas sp.]|uniref:hypothetical protein n=1 Tax=Stenotrophomonas sp. TaxID=69392 RepID=UPI002FC6A297
MHTDRPTVHDRRSADDGLARSLNAGHYNDADSQAAEQRRRAQRTAWKLGLLALAVYVGFILTGVIGR